MTDQAKSYLFAGLAVFFWSTVATAFKIALAGLDILHLMFIASLVSFLVYLLFLLVNGNFRELWKCTGRDVLSSALMGFLNPFLYYLILFKAYSLLPAQVAQPLNMIWPIVLVFLSVPLLGQKIASKSYVALFMGFAGVFLISSQGSIISIKNSDPLGVILATGSSLIWSLYWIYNTRDRRVGELKLFMNFAFALVYTLAAILAGGKTELPSPGAIIPAVYIGLFEMGLTFLFWMKAMKLTRSSDMIGTLVYLAPFLSLLFIRSVLGEQIYLTTVIGLIIIVSGILFQKFPFKGGRGT